MTACSSIALILWETSGTFCTLYFVHGEWDEAVHDKYVTIRYQSPVECGHEHGATTYFTQQTRRASWRRNGWEGKGTNESHKGAFLGPLSLPTPQYVHRPSRTRDENAKGARGRSLAFLPAIPSPGDRSHAGCLIFISSHQYLILLATMSRCIRAVVLELVVVFYC